MRGVEHDHVVVGGDADDEALMIEKPGDRR